MAQLTVSLDSIVRHFESLPDPRHTRNRRHLLGDVLVISVCGVIVGCSGPTSIERWAKAKKDWLRGFLALPNGIPSRDCIRRVLCSLQPEAFQKCFQQWIAVALVEKTEDGESTVAIDGKTVRRSHDHGAGLGPLHMVSAWASEQGLSLGQVATEEKSNEITAIPELLDQIDVKGAIVTIDAMGCQKEIAKKIIAGGGDYVLAVKDNQPTLHEAIKSFFDEHLDDDFRNVRHRRHETCETGHGRRDERYYYLAKLPDNFPVKDEWAGLKAIGLAVRLTEKQDGTTSDDARFFISSRYAGGPRLGP